MAIFVFFSQFVVPIYSLVFVNKEWIKIRTVSQLGRKTIQKTVVFKADSAFNTARKADEFLFKHTFQYVIFWKSNEIGVILKMITLLLFHHKTLVYKRQLIARINHSKLNRLKFKPLNEKSNQRWISTRFSLSLLPYLLQRLQLTEQHQSRPHQTQPQQRQQHRNQNN